MSDKKTDIETDISPAPDAGEPTNLMEPMVISRDHKNHKHLSDLATALQKQGTIASDSNRAPWRLYISVKNAERWLPGALPE